MTAVVRPIGVDDTDFRHRRIPFFFIPEVGLDELKSSKLMGQAHVCRQFFQSGVIHGIEAVDDGNVSRFFPGHFQRRDGVQRGFAGFDG